jgi:penicillin-binding protein activator
MKRYPLFLVLLPLAAASCSSTKYGDPKEAETINVDWGSTDLQTLSAKMVASLKESPSLAYFDRPEKGADKRVITYMGGIRNETSEHINTAAVGDVIRTDLLQSGRFRFAADKKGQEEIGEQVQFQQESGRVDPRQAMAFGKQIGAEVVVYGTLSSIEKKKGRSLESGGQRLEDTYYLLVMNAANVESGEIIWSDKGEIRKTQKTGLFGSR